MKKYTVYMHRNTVNGKCYIGITSQNVKKRWQNGKGYSKTQPKFYRAILKYGWSAFEHIILKTNLTFEEANAAEKAYIKQFNSIENGYNITTGGDGAPGHKISPEAIAKGNLKRKITMSDPDKWAQFLQTLYEVNGTRGKHLYTNGKINKYFKDSEVPTDDNWVRAKRIVSEETREKLRQASTGRPVSEETREKLRQANLGKKHSDETKKKLSDIKKGKPCSDERRQKLILFYKTHTHSSNGLKYSPEQKKKISEATKIGMQNWKQKNPDAYAKMCENVSKANKGKTKSAEAKVNMSLAKQGSKNPNYGGKYSEGRRKAVYCVELDKVFSSVKEAAEQTHSCASHISACCTGRLKSTNKLHWKFITKK